MKTIINISIIFFWLSGKIVAQSVVFKPFKLDILIGIGASKYNVNPLFSIEPKYNIINNLSAGLRWENASLYNTTDSNNGTLRTFGPSGTVNSLIVTGELYVWDDIRVRPFVGGGAGIYFATFSMEKSQAVAKKLGFMIRGGVQIGHFRIVAENNFIPEEAYKLDYLTIKIGTTIGGGRIKK